MAIVNETNCDINIVTFKDNIHIEGSSTQNSFIKGNYKTFPSPEGEMLQIVGNTTETLTIPEFETELPKLETYHIEKLLDEEINDECSTLLYILTEYSISNFKGTSELEMPIEELRKYLDHIIPLSTEIKSECLKKAASLRRSDFELEINVMEGAGLKFKNLSGELFCKLWMKSDEKGAKFTKPVNNGTNPIWNWSDVFPLNSAADDVLYVDIHRKKEDSSSKDDATGTGNDSLNEMSEVVQESNANLKGRGKIKTTDIHCKRSDAWIPIKSPKYKNFKGRLHIATKLKVSGDNCSLNALKRHILLIKLCVQNHLGDSDEMITCWQNMLSEVSYNLVYIHYTIENIPLFEGTLCWFAVVNHLVIKGKKVSFQFRYTLLHKCLKRLRKRFKTNCNVEQLLENSFEDQYKILKQDCLAFIENLHSHDLGGDKYKTRDFEYALKTILLSKAVLGIRCDSLIISEAQAEAQKWYEKLTQEISACEDKPRYFIETLKNQIEFQTSADKVLGKVFPGTKYTSVIFNPIDAFINEVLKKSIKDLKQDSEDDIDEHMYIALNVFRVSKAFINYTYKATNQSELKILEMCEWFGIEVIENWFEWKKRIAVRQIKMAICFDDAMQMNYISLGRSREKNSSSVEVVKHIIQNHLTYLWELVSIKGSSSVYDAFFINALHECSTVFVSGLLERNSPKNTSEDSHKTGKKRMCVLANDMNFMSSFIEHTIYDTVGAIGEDLPKTEEFLMDWTYKLCTQIRGMHETIINKRVEKISKSTSKLTQSLEIKKYRDFIEMVVWKEARRYMLLDVFQTFLKEIWSYTLIVIEENAFMGTMDGKIQVKKRQCNYQGMLQILEVSAKLFYVNENASFTRFLWNDEVISLQKKLKEASENVTMWYN